MELKGSKTEQNLWLLLRENPRRATSTTIMPVRPKDGYEQIAEYFAESALNEKSMPNAS